MKRVRALGIPTDGDSVDCGDTLVTVCQWWDGPGAKETVRAHIERDSAAASAKKNWIWVYHAPPENSPTSWNGKQFYGDADLSGWIGQYEPDLVFCGHVHQAPFRGGSWGRPHRQNVGVQFRPPDRRRPGACDRRYPRTRSGVVLHGGSGTGEARYAAEAADRGAGGNAGLGLRLHHLRIAIRPWREFAPLLMLQRFQDFVDHAEMVGLVFELAFEIDQIGGHAM